MPSPHHPTVTATWLPGAKVLIESRDGRVERRSFCLANGGLATAADALARAGEPVDDVADLAVEIGEVRIEIAALANNLERALGMGAALLAGFRIRPGVQRCMFGSLRRPVPRAGWAVVQLRAARGA
jgi:hypothetical protein